MLPFFQFGYPSAVNNDIQNGNVINTQWNFMNADFMARSIMNFVPFFGACCYNYPDMGAQLTLPSVFSTGYQLDFNPPQNGNPWAWGNWIQNPLNSWMQNTNGNNNNNNNSTPTTAAERDLQTKINKLQSLLKQIAQSEYAGLDISNEITDAINDSASKKTRQEKYDALLEAFKSLDRDVVRSFIVDAKLSTNPNDGEKVADLLKAGYEDGTEKRTRQSELRSSSKMDEITKWIETINDSYGDTIECPVVTHLTNNYFDILDLVSAWNTNKHTNMIETFAEKYNDLNNETRKNDFYDATIGILATKLTDKAEKLLGVRINGKYAVEDKTDIETLIASVKDANDNKELEKLATEFDKLYATLRRAETKIAQIKVQNYFGFLDEGVAEEDKIFDDSLFVEDTEDDLEAEGLNDVGTDVTLNNSTRCTGSSRRHDNETPKAAAERRLDGMTSHFVKNDDGTYTEKRPEGDDTEPRTFTINDEGKLVNTETGDVATIDSVRTDINSKKEAIQRAEKDADLLTTSDEQETAKAIGKQLYSELKGYTTAEDWNYIKENINVYTNSKNVLRVLNEFNRKSNNDVLGYHSRLGKADHFFGYMSREHGADTDKQECIKQMLSYITKHVEDRKHLITDEYQRKVLDHYLKELKHYNDSSVTISKQDGDKLDDYVYKISCIMFEIDTVE